VEVLGSKSTRTMEGDVHCVNMTAVRATQILKGTISRRHRRTKQREHKIGEFSHTRIVVRTWVEQNHVFAKQKRAV